MNNPETVEGQEKVKSIEQKTARAESLEDLQEILREEVEEVKGTPRRREEGRRIREEATVYTGEELAQRIDDIKETKRHLDSITPQEGLRETAAKLFVESSKDWNEFNYWLMQITADKNVLGKDLQDIEYYNPVIAKAREGVKTLVDDNGQPLAIEKTIPRKYGLRAKFIELMRQEDKEEAA
jgi:hypothetical protein